MHKSSETFANSNPSASAIYGTEEVIAGLRKINYGTCEDSSCNDKLSWDDGSAFSYESTQAVITRVLADESDATTWV